MFSASSGPVASSTPCGDHVPTVTEFKALVVNEVNETDLLDGNGLASPPVEMIRLPIENVSEVAVLSWRWDGDLKTSGSRNISYAVYQAKRTGVRYLFVDVVSIDQGLSGQALIEQVLAFASFYRTVPVILAYDEGDQDLNFIRTTMSRPWISYEVRLLQHNPTKVVYIGHKEYTLWRKLRQFLIESQIEVLWEGNFAQTIVKILGNQISMAYISDFKFIIPSYAGVFAAAYEQMSRNDYLLTAAILCLVPESVIRRVLPHIQLLKYDRYEFKSNTFGNYIILLDGNHIGF
ncbi:hypothetical protein QBC43DRAFT_309853 [Cladorrhinum sp. PSN259]|nr:hypothetical protein QBC43DRAFT_309853 [Cladorrhinum sp. PSN259]